MPDFLKKRPFQVVLDFDGVIHRYSKGWHDGTIYDDPMPGVQVAIATLQKMGARITIFSARTLPRVIGGVSEPGQAQQMAEWFERYRIPYDEIWTGAGKPLGHLYVDDRGLRFESWDIDLPKILDMLDSWSS